MTRKEKRILKRFAKLKPARPILPLEQTPRVGDYYRNLDAFTEYGFLPEKYNACTDEEIEELMEDAREEIRSPYDCTGLRFTMWIKWHRNPNGRISYVHRFGIDV